MAEGIRMSFLSEIKRRKVFRLAAAYVVIAWVIIEVVTTVEEPLRIPDWFDTTVIILLAIGFPIAVMLSWAYDITPEGVVREDTGEQAPAPLQFDYGKVALGAVLLLVAFLLGRELTGPPSAEFGGRDNLAERFHIEITSNSTLDPRRRWSSGLTPDGRTIVIQASVDGVSKLFSRDLGDLEFRSIDGTQNANVPFEISPDGGWLVFQEAVEGLLMKTRLSGGPPVPLGNPNGELYGDLAWGENGYIVFAISNHTGLLRVHEDGGETEELTTPEAGQDHTHPAFIPGTDTVILTVGDRAFLANPTDRLAFLTSDGELHVTDVEGASPKIVANDRLVYFNRRALWSAEFDRSNFEISRERTPIADNVAYTVTAMYNLSLAGSLLYQNDGAIRENTLVWVDRDGNEELALPDPDVYAFPSISPDGDTLVVLQQGSIYGSGLWAHSLSRGTSTRLTSKTSRDVPGPFSPDGRYIYYHGTRNEDIYRSLVSGAGAPEQLTDTPFAQYTLSITADGEMLFVEQYVPKTVIGWLDPTAALPEIREIWRSDHEEYRVVISPDDKWLAFTSERSGNSEIYVRPFPKIDDGLWQISNGGVISQWGRDASEIFYLSGDDVVSNELMSVAIDFVPEFKPGIPVALFSLRNYIRSAGVGYEYDATRDKFLFVKSPIEGEAPANEMILVKNWQALLDEPSN